MVDINPLVEILLEEPDRTATNKEFAEWLIDQEELQKSQSKKEVKWKDSLWLRYEKKEDEGDADQNGDS